MTRAGSGRSEWERRQAAQRRENERLARERARREREREKARKEQHVEAQQRLAAVKTTDVEQRVTALDRVLADVLDKRPLSFGDLAIKLQLPAFEPPERLRTAAPRPEFAAYAPMPPGALGRLFGGESRYERALEDAQRRYRQDLQQYQRQEDQRISGLAAAHADHTRKVQEVEAEAAAENAKVTRHRVGVEAGEAESIEWFVTRLLESSRYPSGFPHKIQVAYRPENRDVIVDFELPPNEVIPNVRGYKYVKIRDAIDPIPRPQAEVKQRYAQLIARVALRTLHEIFAATPVTTVEAIVFNGRLTTTDLATGKEVRPHLVSVEAERPDFTELVLAKVNPAACLKRLNALVSPNPYDVEAVEPFIAFDLKRFRFSEDMDVISGLDSRPNLMKLSPTEFEHLIRQLFIAMGAEAWTTVPSKDGGVDAVATSKNMFFGGVCLIQAKRWSNVVGLEAVHALTGVMTDHNATTGVLVTPSWFGRASEQFAQRNRIRLINGAELKHLLKEHLGLNVIPGVTPPRRVRASNNTQTGRPGP